MSYPAGEALILTALRAHANYSSDNTSRADWKVLNSGRAAFYVVIRMGETENAPLGFSSALTSWTTQLMIYQRYIDDGTTAENLQARVQEILEHMEKYNTLDDTTGTVVDSQVSTIGAMEKIQMVERGPLYARSIMNIDWREQRNITFI